MPVAAVSETVRFFFRGADGRALPKLELGVFPAAKAEEAAHVLTDSHGLWAASVDALPEAFTLAHFGPRSLPWEQGFQKPLRSEYVLVLPGLATLSGSVAFSDGPRVVTRPWVLVYPRDHPPVVPPGGDLSSMTSILVTRADEAGDFVLPGIATETEYFLTVGGGGVGLRQPLPLGIPSGRHCAVLVEALFAVRIEIEGLPEEPAWEAPGLQWFWSPRETQATGLDADSLSARLAGVDSRESGPRSRNPKTMLFLGPWNSDSVGPVRLTGTPAGCLPIDRAIRIPRSEGPLQDLLIPVDCIAQSWGSARVSFDGLAEGDARELHRTRRFGKLRFHPTDGAGPIEVPFLSWPIDGSILVPNLPAGSYSVDLTTESGFSGFPARDPGMEIPPGGMGTVSFDLSQSCSVEVIALDVQGHEHSGELLVQALLGTGSTGAGSTAHFLRPPYLIQGLIPGRYEFFLYKPFQEPEPITMTLATDRRTTSIVFEPSD